MKTIKYKDAYRMYWTVFIDMIGDENVEFTFYRSISGFLESKYGQVPVAEVEKWCGDNRDFPAHEVFACLAQYFAQIACEAAKFAQPESISVSVDDL